MRKYLGILFILFSAIFISCQTEGDEEESNPVTSISFEKEHIKISKGSTNAVALNIGPEERIRDCEVEYSLSENSSKIVSLSKQSSTGLVITGENKGSVVVIAKCEGLTAYLEVDVYSDIMSDTPFIEIPEVAYELKVGDKRSFQVMLSGGDVHDNPLFEFSSSDNSVVKLESADNACMLSCEKEGFAKICVSHPKSEYPSYVMVFVSKENENPVYITSQSNVYVLSEKGGTENIYVQLANTVSPNLSLFTFDIINGSDVIDIISNNNVVSVTPKKNGEAVIKVFHTSSLNELLIHIIVVNEECPFYVDTKQSFFEMNIGDSARTEIYIGGDDDKSIFNPVFNYKIEDESVCECIITSTDVYIKAKKSGRTKITVTNSLCINPHELYVVVNGEADLIYYISTLQNVVRLEEGDENYELNINLVGGNEGDRNSFKWTVSDSSVCEVVTNFGEVKYTRSAVYSGPDNLEAKAFIKAKKTGSCDIEITHPKCEGKLTIKVMVYPSGTLSGIAPVVKGPGLVKVLKGSTQNIQLELLSGSSDGIVWESDNNLIASVSGNELNAVISGNGSGNCCIKALKNSKVIYSCVAVSGSQAEIDGYNIISFDDSVVSILKGTRAYFKINCTNEVFSEYTCAVNDQSLCEATVIDNVLCVKGLSAGECQIAVSNPDCSNTAYLLITIYDESTISKPYYFEYDKFASVLIGRSVDLSVNLVGADSEEKSKIRWETDSDLFTLDYSSNQCRVTGLKKGKGYIYASSDKSSQNAKFIVNVCETEEELNDVVIDVTKTNYLCKTGDDIYISCDISDSSKRNEISWDCSDIGIIRVDSNYESAILRCLSEGDAIITVSCSNALPVKIFVSVRDEIDLNTPRISLMPYIELDEGESVNVNAVITGLSDTEINQIKWKCEDENVCSFISNGNSIIIRGLEEGYTTITATLSSLAIKSQMSVIVYKPGSPRLPVISLSKALYNLTVGESTDVKLTYGSIKPSDSDITTLKWESDSDAAEITYNGNVCSINAVHEGIAKIRVYSPKFLNEVNFTVCIGSRESNGYSFTGNKIVRLVKGRDTDYEYFISDEFGKYINSYDSVIISEDDPDNVIDWTNVANCISISGNKKGNCILTLSHPDLNEQHKILVYVYDSESEMNSSFVIAAKKENYLLRKGEEVKLELEYSGKTENLSKIKWSLDNSGCVNYTVSSDKTYVTVRAKKEGNVIFTAKHDKFDGEAKFYVSVTDFSSDYKKVSIITPSLVFLELNNYNEENNEKTIEVNTSLSSTEEANLIWFTSDDSIVNVTGNGRQAVFKPLSRGICEVTCKYDEYNYSVMVVKVCENAGEMVDSKLFNIECRNIFLQKGQSKSILPFTGYNVFSTENASYSDMSDNGVIRCENKNGKLYIEALNEGVAVIKCEQDNIENAFFINVIVTEDNLISDNINEEGYITSAKYVYAVNPDYPMDCARLSVIPVGIKESLCSEITWNCSDNNICAISGNGKECLCYPVNEGRCTVTASSVWSTNKIDFLIISSKDSITYIPSIKPSCNTMRLKAGEEGEFSFEITSVNNVDISKFTYENSQENVCQITPNGNTLYVKGLSQGQSVIKVSYPGTDEINLVVSVSGVVSNLIYLSSSSIYNVVGIGSSISLNAELHNYDEKNQKNYIWSIAEGNEFISLNGSGKNVVIKGIKTGHARVSCMHSLALCPVEYEIEIVDSSDYKPVYMKTDTVITMEEGERSTISVELVNGNPGEEGYFNWNVPSDSSQILRVTSSGSKAVVQALSSGIGRITVSHPSCVSIPSMDIIVVVNEKAEGETLVITTDSTIIEGKVSDSYRTVNVTLAGGTAEQQLLFTWEIISQDSIKRNADGSSMNVVTLVSQGGDQNIIKYINEGTAIVRVRNSATSYYLDIKFIINEYSNLRFEKASVTINQYESTTVSVQSPSSKTVVYNSSDEDICRVYGTNQICCIEGIKEGYAVITARASDGSYEDKLSVRINKSLEAVPLYISSSTNLITLDMSDKEGIDIKATLCGTIEGNPVSDEENDYITWNIESATNEVIKFAAMNTMSVTGTDCKIIPVQGGVETIVISHPKTQKKKMIYVTVKSLSSTVTLDSLYGVFEKGDIGTVTAKLGGVKESEEANITWTTADFDKVSLIQDGTENESINGATCLFRCKELCEEGCIITCSYRDVVRTYTVFVKALPSLHIMVSSDTVRTGQSKYYNIVCTPEDYIGDLNYTFSSSNYVKTSEGGVLMTGLVRNDAELVSSKDNPPSSIRTPYFKVTGGVKEGSTQFFFECKNLTSTLNVTTDNTVALDFISYDEYDKYGNIISHSDSPSVIDVRANSAYTRLYYNLEPEISITQFDPAEITVDLRNAFRNGKVTLKNGKNTGTTGRYVDIYPDAKGCNYGDIYLYEGEQRIGVIRVSFTMPDSLEKFTFNYENNVPPKYRYDIENGYVTGCGKGNAGEGSQAVMYLNYSAPYFYAVRDEITDVMIPVETDVNLFDDAPRFRSSSDINSERIKAINRMKNTVLVRFEWPTGYGLTGTYSKYFVFYEEIRY